MLQQDGVALDHVLAVVSLRWSRVRRASTRCSLGPVAAADLECRASAGSAALKIFATHW